ncbi:hypothetical protein HO173_004790 [Letharia columbiana]|uniref:Uncharacterized protein n=1 Tax=Letharia columbiana TaxID=112416 RepID=A0A8H6FZ00_9LECA|nr:uncharacterized protein HO173_004790 [Letharia columbiana]KAF6237321.1 hypothetical protein HO173_004790 [Letharia columbiana]
MSQRPGSHKPPKLDDDYDHRARDLGRTGFPPHTMTSTAESEASPQHVPLDLLTVGQSGSSTGQTWKSYQCPAVKLA